MSNEVKIKITAENDTNKTVSDVKAGMHDVETAADKAGNKLDKFAVSSKSIKDDLGKLDKAALSSKTALEQLTSALANTDDAAQRLDIKKAISKVQSDLNSTLKARKIKLAELIDTQNNEKDGRNIATRLLSSIGKGLSSGGDAIAGLASNHIGITIGGAIGAAAAPVIVSSIGSIISSGAGLGVIGVGVMAAVKSDSTLQDAGKAAGKKFFDSISASADKAFKGPILESLNILSKEGDKAAAQLGEAFNNLAPSIAPFTKDLATSVDLVVTSLTKAANNSGPAIEGLGHSFILLSQGASNFVDQVSNGGPEAAANLELIAGALGDVLTQTGTFLGFLEKLSENEFLTGPLLPLLRKHYHDASVATDEFKGATDDAANAMIDTAHAAFVEGNELTNLHDDMKAATDPVFGLLTAQDKLAEATANAAKQTKEHGKNSKEAKQALRDLAEAAIDVEGKAGDLAEVSGGELTPALKATLEAAGLTKDQIAQLKRQFDSARGAGDKFAQTYHAKLEADAVTATQRIKHVRDLLDQIHSKKISVNVLVNESRLEKVANTLARFSPADAHGGITGAANGATSSGLTLVGENGPELLRLPPSTNVKSNPDTMRAMNDSSEVSTLVISPGPNGSRDLMAAIIKGLRYEVSRNGSGSVQRLLGDSRVAA